MIVKSALVILSFVSMFSIGLQFSKKKGERIFNSAVGIAIIINLFVIPILAYVLLLIFEVPNSYRIAIGICSLSAGGTSGAIFVIRSHADPFIGGSLILILNTIGSIFIPILFYLSMDLSNYDPILIVSKLLMIGLSIQALPLLLGIIIRRKWNSEIHSLSKNLNKFANILLLFCIAWLTFENYKYLLDVTWQPILVITILSILASNFGFFFPYFSQPIRSAISAVTGVRNLTIALILVEFVWNDSKISLGVMLYGAIMFIIAYISSTSQLVHHPN